MGVKCVSHRSLWLCSACPGESSLMRCTEHEHGLVCIGGSDRMLALSTVALMADYPRLAPAFSRRSCFTSWWWRRWVERETPPSDVVDWLADSSLVRDQHNTVRAAELCAALRDFRPSLRKWGDALAVRAVPWTAVAGDSRRYLAQLSLPAPGRRGLADITNQLLSAAEALGRDSSFVVDGSVALMLDPAVAVWALPSMGHSYSERRLRMVRHIRQFGTTFSTPVAHSPIQFTLRALAHVCRPPHTMDVFPTHDVIAQLICRSAGNGGRGDDVEAAGAGGRGGDAAAGGHGAAADTDGEADNEEDAGDGAGAGDGSAGDGRAGGDAAAGGHGAAADTDGEANNVEEADDGALDEICARVIDPSLLKRRLDNVCLRLAPGFSWHELLRLSRSSQPLLFGHGTTVEAAVLARRWGLHDPRLRAWMRMGVPPGCSAFYYVPIINETSIFCCASFALAKHTVADEDGRRVEPSQVEVLLCRAPERVYDPAHTKAGRHVFGGPHPKGELNPVLGVLNLLQLRAGRFVNWVTMCGMQVMRLLTVHPVAVETGLAGAMLGEVTDAARNVANVFHADGRSQMEVVGSFTFDVLPAEE